jgi:tripartite ATP-independent transporter DctM subunit
MSIELVTLLMFGSLVLLLISGLPIGFSTASIAVIFALFLWGPASLYIIGETVFNWMNSYALVAVPMFIFMANVLSRTGIVDDLFDTIYLWAGPLKGGLAVVTVLVSTLMAAMVGIVGATEVTMGLVALPAMLKRKYDKSIACGCVCAGGSLGYLIPPSIVFIFYGLAAGESVGKLFMGGMLPGLLLTALYVAYIIIRSFLQPDLAPPLPKEERQIPLKKKMLAAKALVLPTIVILVVLGSIYLGVTSITEASGVGAIGALACAAVKRKLNWQQLKESGYQTIRVTSMVVWLCVGSTAFISVYTALGGTQFAKEVIVGLPLGRWGILIFMQIFLIFLGCFIDWLGILMLTLPIFLPIIKSLGFNPLWYGVLFNINMQIAQLTPPFGMALFYLKGVAPPGIKIGDIYSGIWPFVLLQMLGLGLTMMFPQIALWLPTLMKGS